MGPTIGVGCDTYDDCSTPDVDIILHVMGECGVLSRVELTSADPGHLLRDSRPSGKASPDLVSFGGVGFDYNVDTFIHPLRCGVSMSVYRDQDQFRRMLSRDVVLGWTGWPEAHARIEVAVTSTEDNRIAEELVIGYSRISMVHVDVRYPGDQERRCMLVADGLNVGKGEVHGYSNSRLADSMLQLLLWHDAITKPVFASAGAESNRRCASCASMQS